MDEEQKQDTPEETSAASPEEQAPASESAEAGPEQPAGETAPHEEPAAVPETAAEPAASEETSSAAEGLTLGAGAPAETEEEEAEPKPPPVIRGKVDRFGVAMGTGRRKTSVARVRIKQGDGSIKVNGRDLKEYFHTEQHRLMVEAPLRATETHGNVEVAIRVNGGGATGQAGAAVLGIARALEAMNPSLHPPLDAGGYLTRDDRMVERKKYGLKKSRKSPQFSKR